MEKDDLWISILFVVGLVLFMFASCAKAEGLEVIGHITSHHFESDYDFNETNLGVGFDYQVYGRFGVVGGFFDNSYDDTSVYVGGSYSYDLCADHRIRCEVGLIGGIITGYDNELANAHKYQPLILPQVKLGINDWFVSSVFIPKINDDTVNVLTFSLGREF